MHHNTSSSLYKIHLIHSSSFLLIYLTFLLFFLLLFVLHPQGHVNVYLTHCHAAFVNNKKQCFFDVNFFPVWGLSTEKETDRWRRKKISREISISSFNSTIVKINLWFKVFFILFDFFSLFVILHSRISTVNFVLHWLVRVRIDVNWWSLEAMICEW